MKVKGEEEEKPAHIIKMKITEELINELDQLDRMEFRQRYYHLDTSKALGGIAFILIFISMLFAPIRSFYIFIIPIIIMGIYLFYLDPKQQKELIKEYFSVQVKRNERGKK